MKRIYLFVVLLLLSACSLNGAQEAALNDAVTSYIDARNEGVLVTYVAYTHPNAVDYYLKQGDDEFKQRFDLNSSENSVYLQDGSIKQIESKGKTIHIAYEFMAIREQDFDITGNKVIIYAVSVDDGTTWQFIDGDDYTNNNIINKKDRLIQ